MCSATRNVRFADTGPPENSRRALSASAGFTGVLLALRPMYGLKNPCYNRSLPVDPGRGARVVDTGLKFSLPVALDALADPRRPWHARRHPRGAAGQPVRDAAYLRRRRHQYRAHLRYRRLAPARAAVPVLAHPGTGAGRRAGHGAALGAARAARRQYAYRRLHPAGAAVGLQRGLWRLRHLPEWRLALGHAGRRVLRRHGRRHLLPQLRRAPAGRGDDLPEPGADVPGGAVHRRGGHRHRLHPDPVLPGQHEHRLAPAEPHPGVHHAVRARERPPRQRTC